MKFRPRVENALAVLGDLELKRGHFETARGHYEKSLQIARELHDMAGEAQATLGLGRIAMSGGDNRDALDQSEKACALFQRLGEPVPLAAALTLKGDCLHRLEREAEAADAYQEAISAIEAVRSRVAGGDQEREQFFAQEIAPYHEMISLLVRQNKPEQALAMAERASARVLLDIASGGRAEYAAVLNPEEQRRQRALEVELASADRELARLRTAENPPPRRSPQP